MGEEPEPEPEEAAPETPAPKTPTMNVPKLTIPDGEEIDFNDINRQRTQKDLIELQRLIEQHFVQRKADEDELELLRKRIERKKKTKRSKLLLTCPSTTVDTSEELRRTNP